VHPTPIYETLAMGMVTYLLWRLRDRLRPGLLFALYLVLAGAERFLIEFIRRNDDVALGLTQAQLLSIAMVIAGGVWLVAKGRAGGLDRPSTVSAD
jgi:phosphatidylglycerol:prolipoprotein diacylglycerol transferase